VQIVKRDARQCGHVKKQIAPAVGSDEPKSTICFLLDCAFGHLTLSSSSSSTLQQPPRFAVSPEYRYRTVASTADLAETHAGCSVSRPGVICRRNINRRCSSATPLTLNVTPTWPRRHCRT
jgi:hypothetical protein